MGETSMKKRITSLICAMAMSMILIAEPAFAEENVNESETLVENESIKETDMVLNDSVGTADEVETELATEPSTENLQESSENIQAYSSERSAEISVSVTESGSGKYIIKISGIEEVGVSKVYAPTWSMANQEDIYWYKADKQSDGSYIAYIDLKNHQNHLGNYTTHIYLESQTGEKTVVGSTNFNAVLNAGDFTTSFQNNGYSMRVKLDNINTQGMEKAVCFAVWSRKNGQDDLIWYEAQKDGNGYATDVWFYNHKDSGVYDVHTYVKDENGNMHFLKSTTFNVDSLPKEALIEVSDADNSRGTFNVTVYLNYNENDISKVYVPVWCKADQSDIRWYEAEAQSNGSYFVEVDIKNHQYHTGRYSIHAYIENKNGSQNLVGSMHTSVEVGAEKFSASKTEYDYIRELTLNSVVTQGIAKKIYFAVWSAKNGQDDLYWYEASGNGTDYSVDVLLHNHASSGLYYAHAYMEDKDGGMHFLKGLTFNIDKVPAVSEMTITDINNNQGTFNVNLYLTKSGNDISKVYVPVWCKADQSDIRWYEAERKGNGRYTVQVNVKNHQYHIGDYTIHSYILDKNNKLNFINSGKCSLRLDTGEFSDSSTGKNYSIKLTLDFVATQGIEDSVLFAVWSAKNGQDDLHWYTANKEGSGYVIDVLLYNHKNIGTYIAHAYIRDKNGEMHFLKDITFEVDSLPEETIEIENVNQTEGTFDVKVLTNRPADGIKYVWVPVWCNADQSDIYWYKAERQGNGEYKATVDALKHKWHSGDYTIHSYVESPSGEKQFIKEGKTRLQLGYKAVTERLDSRSVRVRLYGVSDNVRKMDFAAWSVQDGSDDMVWYSARRNSDGTWSADIHSKWHKAAGEYVCHMYITSGGARFAAETTFNIEEKWENTWRWINGYKRYINSDGEIDTDVSRLVTGPFYIKVYKWSNYLIVFAKDEYGNYTVPVKAMVTSCGNGTPTGTYYSPMKFRWLTMVGGSKAQWCTQITGDYLFHSVPYRIADPTTLYTDLMYNYLGTTQSLGCIRLQAGDAKWIYDNCSLGTEIYITPYESGGPIDKPLFTPVPSWHTWDPTDPTVRYLCEQYGCH